VARGTITRNDMKGGISNQIAIAARSDTNSDMENACICEFDATEYAGPKEL
jgi:hypothetical protein